MDSDVDQNAEALAEVLATQWGALFRRLKDKGLRRFEAIVLMAAYIHGSQLSSDVTEYDDD